MTMQSPTRFLAVGALALSQLVGCAAKQTTASTTPPATTQQTQPQTVVVLRNDPNPPALTEAQIAADASDPNVVVVGDSPWIVVPSFRLGVQLPVGWYRKTQEQILAGLRRSYDAQHQLSAAEEEQFSRSLRGAADRFPEGANIMGLIPSVRVLLVPGGGIPPQDFCERLQLPNARQTYPYATLTRSEWMEVQGRRAARCSNAVTANTLGGSFPGVSDTLWIFGDSHIVLIASVGNASDPVAATLDAAIASIRAL